MVPIAATWPAVGEAAWELAAAAAGLSRRPHARPGQAAPATRRRTAVRAAALKAVGALASTRVVDLPIALDAARAREGEGEACRRNSTSLPDSAPSCRRPASLRSLDGRTLLRGAARRPARRGARAAAAGRLVTYSPKVFIPLTTLCRDVCGYCTFARPPRRGERAYLTEAEVLAIARAGAAAGCTEALFTLGDKPELRYRVARDGARGARLRDDDRVPRRASPGSCSRRPACCRT